MINQHFYIARLIARYLSDEIGEEEQAELTRWRDESPENERLFQEICKEENIKQNMQKTDGRECKEKSNAIGSDIGY